MTTYKQLGGSNMALSYILKDNEVIEEQRQIPVLVTTDVVVAGGGVSGIAAAIGAARCGAKTVLIENNSFLGGVATANLM